ncbi:MAG: hypothetical protein LBJ70_00275 [Holosporales bacterium]|nr:hypothetical protein [Holosporales bacterium]
MECCSLFLIDLSVRLLTLNTQHRRFLDGLTVGFGALLWMGLMHYATLQAALKPLSELPSIGTLAPLGLFLFGICPALIGKRWYTLLLSLYCVMALGRWEILEIRQSTPKETLSSWKSVSFKKRPNVYLFFLESYSDLTSLETIYHIDTSAVRHYMATHGYSMYENCFSNYDQTLVSEGALFGLHHHWYRIAIGLSDVGRNFRRLLGGENPVLRTFKENHYKTNCLLLLTGEIIPHANSKFDFYEKIPRSHMARMMDGSWKAPERRLWEWVAHVFSLLSPSSLYFFRGEPFLPFHTTFETMRSHFLKRVQEGKASGVPQFFFIHTGAQHSAYKGDMRVHRELFDRFQTRDYALIRQDADTDLANMLAILEEHDPEALVILIGDHGARRYRGIERGEGEINALIRSRGLEPSLVARDAMGVFCAIRWRFSPLYFTAETIVSHVNLFRRIFAELAEDPALLEDCETDASYLLTNDKLYLVVENGKLLLN